MRFLRSLCLLPLLAGLLVDQLTQAKPALDHRFRGPHYNTEVLQQDVLDLQVKALGGSISISRAWRNGQWVWNDRRASLKILGLADPTVPLGAANPLTLERDAEGRIVAVKDHPGNILITFAYIGIRLASVKGSSSREVKYQYSSEWLAAVTDVLGPRWRHHYDASGLAGYTDPLGQRTFYVLGKKDSLQEARLPDGLLTKCCYGYEQSAEQFYMREVAQSDGLLRYTKHTLKEPAGNPILDHPYQYDAVGNIIALEGEVGTTPCRYDKLYRLTQAKYPQDDARSKKAYAYDDVGNCLDAAASAEALDISQWQYNSHSPLVSHDGIGYRYDGDLIEKGALQADKTLKQADCIDHWLYRYDSRERLVEVQKSGRLLATYACNLLGQRISINLAQSSTTTCTARMARLANRMPNSASGRGMATIRLPTG